MGRADNTVYMQDRIKDYLLRPAAMSKGQMSRIRQGFSSGDFELTTREASNVLNDIRAMDPELAARLIGYTPHDSCQISLIRDVLLQIWNAGRLQTKPVPVIGAQPVVRAAPLGAMA